VPLYVIALTDAPIETGRIGGRAARDIEIDGIHAICQRRRQAPALTDDVLRAQHRVVVEIARRSRAILPVRFGALLAEEVLVDRVRDHDSEIRRALAEVRDRVQMTNRILGVAPRIEPVHASSGRQYLEQRQKLASPEIPPVAGALLDALRPLARRERREPGAAGLLVNVYHLVDDADVSRYAAILRQRGAPNVVSSGPWPPFAFTPELW
jgi:hypothetical protein